MSRWSRTYPTPTVQLSDSGPFTIHPDATGSEVASEWPSLGGDTTRNGQSATEGLADGRTPWEQNTGTVLSSVTIGFDGRIHAASEDGRLYTFAADGNALWTLDVNAPLISAPSIGPDGSLFVGGRDGKLRAIAPDGTLRWTFSTDDAVYSSPAVDADGNVYFGSTDGMVYALAADGSERWQFATKGTGRVATGAVLAAPAIGTDGTIYIGGLYDPNLYALNPADGRVEWACRFEAPSDSASPGWPFAAPVIGRDGTIYQTLLYDSHLYAIDPSDGTILWGTDLLDAPQIDPTADDFNADADGWSEPALAPDGTIYVSLDDPYLRAVNPDGTIKWVTKLGDLGAFTLTVDARGWVYAACDDGYVYLVDPRRSAGRPMGHLRLAGLSGPGRRRDRLDR